MTFWIVGDFDSPSGRQLLYDAIKHQASFSDFILGGGLWSVLFVCLFVSEAPVGLVITSVLMWVF